MNKKPVLYMQTDIRWKNTDYSAKGENTTIGRAGCGPTCAAMLIETITGKTYTPIDAAKWSLAHGYKALNQGTYYSYFVPQFKEFGITCTKVNNANLYKNPSSSYHQQVFDALKEGYYAIACMGPGTWTSGGHFIVLWWKDDKVRINDPASTKTARVNGDVNAFKNEVKYYWLIDAREYNGGDTVTQDQFDKMMETYLEKQRNKAPSEWSKPFREWAEGNGLIAGDDKNRFMYQSFLTREQFFTVLYRFEERIKKLFGKG